MMSDSPAAFQLMGSLLPAPNISPTQRAEPPQVRHASPHTEVRRPLQGDATAGSPYQLRPYPIMAPSYAAAPPPLPAAPPPSHGSLSGPLEGLHGLSARPSPMRQQPSMTGSLAKPLLGIPPRGQSALSLAVHNLASPRERAAPLVAYPPPPWSPHISASPADRPAPMRTSPLPVGSPRPAGPPDRANIPMARGPSPLAAGSSVTPLRGLASPRPSLDLHAQRPSLDLQAQRPSLDLQAQRPSLDLARASPKLTDTELEASVKQIASGQGLHLKRSPLTIRAGVDGPKSVHISATADF